MAKITSEFRKMRALVGAQITDQTLDPTSEVAILRGEYEAHLLTDSQPLYALRTRQILPGQGLAGGGDLSANRTLSVFLPSSSGLAKDISGLWVDTAVGGGLKRDLTGLSVDKAQAFTWSGIHHFQQPTYMDNVLNTQSILPQLTDTYDLGSSTLMWRKGWLSELKAVLFALDTIQVHGGWDYIVKYANTLPVDLPDSGADIIALDLKYNAPVGDYLLMKSVDDSGLPKMEYMIVIGQSSTTVKYLSRNIDGSGKNSWAKGTPYVILGQAPTSKTSTGVSCTSTDTVIGFGQAMTIGAYVVLTQLNGAQGYEVVKINSLSSGTAYNVSRAQANSVAQTFTAAAAREKAGYGDGRIEMYAYDGKPRISVLAQGALYGDQKEHIRLGYLDSWQGAGLTGIGFAVGDFAAGKYLRYTASDSTLEVKGIVKADSGYLGDLNINGTLTLATSTAKLIQGTGTWGSNFTGSAIWSDSGAMNIGGWNDGVKQWWGGSDGTFNFGNGNIKLSDNGLRIIVANEAADNRSIRFMNESGYEMGSINAIWSLIPLMERSKMSISARSDNSSLEPMVTLAVNKLGVGRSDVTLYTDKFLSSVQIQAPSINGDSIAATSNVKSPRFFTDLPANILDDGVFSFTPGNIIGVIMVNTRSYSYAGAWAIINYRAYTTPFAIPLVVSSSIETSTAALTPGSGTDGKLTISAAADGKIYISNRLGMTISIGYTIFGA